MDLALLDEDNLLSEAHTKLVQALVDFAGEQLGLPTDTEISITIVDDDRINQINREYRDTDRVTDVISFAIEEDPEALHGFTGIPRNIGDLFIDPAQVGRQAQDYGHSVARELGYTVVHGILHLTGYDHIDPADEAVMIPLQEKILDAYGLKR